MRITKVNSFSSDTIFLFSIPVEIHDYMSLNLIGFSYFLSKVSIYKILPRSLQHYNRHVLVYDYIIGTSWGVHWFFCWKNKGLKHLQLLFLGRNNHGIVSRFHHSILLKAFNHFFKFLCLLFFSTLSLSAWALGTLGFWSLGSMGAQLGSAWFSLAQLGSTWLSLAFHVFPHVVHGTNIT